MMSEQAKDLSNFIKSVHRNLRIKYNDSSDKEHGDIWDDHVKNVKLLSDYSSKMHDLATHHWANTKVDSNSCRVRWIYKAIEEYFVFGGFKDKLEKERRKIAFQNHDNIEYSKRLASFGFPEKSLQVLDVGSCYNPFKIFKNLNVTAIDLFPAVADVIQCDFVKVSLCCQGISLQTDEKDKLEASFDKRGFDPLSPKNNTSCIKRAFADGDNPSFKNYCSKKFKPVGNVSRSIVKDYIDSSIMDNIELFATREETHYDPPVSPEKTATDPGCTQTSLQLFALNADNELNENVNERNYASINYLIEESYDVVIFSLFLEYLPTPELRYLCCEKAYKLLSPAGLLCIVTPDSKHQGGNAPLFKLWKIALLSCGFNRVKYEKLEHFHGMVFRKGILKEVWVEDSIRELEQMKRVNVKGKFRNIDYDKVFGSIFIPQDLEMLIGGNTCPVVS